MPHKWEDSPYNPCRVWKSPTLQKVEENEPFRVAKKISNGLQMAELAA